MPITVKQIIESYLKANDLDGLCNEDCGCGVGDLAPCGEIQDTCKAAFKDESEDDNFYEADIKNDKH